MKKILFILILSSCSLVQGQKIKTSGIFETGYEDRSVSIYTTYPSGMIDKTPWCISSMYGSLYLDADWKGLSAYTSNKTYFNKQDKYVSFIPLQSEFTIGMKYNYKSIFSIGYEHMCSHAIESVTLNEGYDRIYLRIKMFSLPMFLATCSKNNLPFWKLYSLFEMS